MSSITAYLDWSTLFDAFQGVDKPTSEAHGRLLSVVQQLSRTRSLVISPTHVAELLVWSPKERALTAAPWLDSLNFRWMRAHNPENDDELHSWLDSVDPKASPRRYEPFADTLAEAYAPIATSEAIAALRGDYSIKTRVMEAHDDPTGHGARAFSVDRLQALHEDRRLNESIEPAEARQILAGKFRYLLIRKGLTRCPSSTRRSPRRLAEVEAAVDRVLAIPESIPFNRAASCLVHELGGVVPSQDPGSARFRKRFSSMSYDLQHLLGAAYGDIFTCDRTVAQALGDFRERRGMMRQSSLGVEGSLDAFVDTLEAQIKSAAQT